MTVAGRDDEIVTKGDPTALLGHAASYPSGRPSRGTPMSQRPGGSFFVKKSAPALAPPVGGEDVRSS